MSAPATSWPPAFRRQQGRRFLFCTDPRRWDDEEALDSLVAWWGSDIALLREHVELDEAKDAASDAQPTAVAASRINHWPAGWPADWPR